MDRNAAVTSAAPIPAGDFSTWLVEMQTAIRGEGDAVVPCGTCTACCRSSQFVHIGPDETETLSRVPPALLFPAPGLPAGHVLMGYDERGHCPMLVDDRCSIYEHRPITCRTYDCRAFPATGIDVSDEKPLVGERARRWRFDDSGGGAVLSRAVRASAAFLAEHPDVPPAEIAPRNPTERAALAIMIHEAFLERDEGSGAVAVVEPDPERVRLELQRQVLGRAD